MKNLEQIDIAVDLGLLPPPVPRIKAAGESYANFPPEPPQLVDGLLHQGCKLILGGTSKSNKSWCLIHLGMAVAAGGKWWGRQCAKTDVLYVNFELPEWSLISRMDTIARATPDCRDNESSFHTWHLRGYAADLTLLRPELERELDRRRFGLILFDPAYKLLGSRDENSNGDIASLMNEFEAIARRTGAAVGLAHHFAKGDSTSKDPIDRMSGAGSWARDPDSLLVMTPHEEEDCYTVNTILRNMPRLPQFVVQWEFPVMRMAPELNPEALRTRNGRRKSMTDHEFTEAFLGSEPRSRKMIVDAAVKTGISRTTTDRYLKNLVDGGVITCNSGLYWVKTP